MVDSRADLDILLTTVAGSADFLEVLRRSFTRAAQYASPADVGFEDRPAAEPMTAGRSRLFDPGVGSRGCRKESLGDLEIVDIGGPVHVEEHGGVAEVLLDAGVSHHATAAV